MITKENIYKGLQVIGFQEDASEWPSIIFVSELNNANSKLTPFQILEVEKASYFKADAVFFRYFNDGRPPLPQFYIYDKSADESSINNAQIHKELWSNCHIPSFVVIEKTALKFFDCRKPVSSVKEQIYTKETAFIDLTNIAEYADVIEKYNAGKFKNGSFWESDEAYDNYLYGKTAYSNLIKKLKELRKDYDRKTKLSQRLFDYVIIISTLIKFLEENGIDTNGDNLAGEFFQEKVTCNSFIEILKENKLVEILGHLSKKFNGGIFDLSENDKIELAKADLSKIINFFDAKVDGKGQLSFWELYSFKHIPVELISNIYEEFLPEKDKGAVYTPHYLVNFLIDECLPIPAQKNDKADIGAGKKIIDVSCGSGIFLVNTYKRLVQIYQINEYYKSGSFPKKMGIRVLQKILKDNIFGVDVNKNAVELSIFSLQLALCQMLSPKQIWTELTFQDLSRANILQKDFFEFISDNKKHGQFDLVIGNPPFNPPLKNDGTEYKPPQYFKEITDKYTLATYPIGDCNIALLFLQLSNKLLKINTGLLCLIQPANSLLHKKPNKPFRAKLFEEMNVVQVIDFTTLRRILFPTATVPACAVFIKNNNQKNEYITHVVMQRTNPSKQRLYFEIDKYDIHSISREDAADNCSWKSNLFGGYRLYNLIQRIKKNNENVSLSQVITNHKAENYSIVKPYLTSSTSICFETKITDGVFPRYVVGNTKGNTDVIAIFGDKATIAFIKSYLDSYSSFLASYIAGTSSRQGLGRPYDLVPYDILELPVITQEGFLTVADKILTADVSKYKISQFGQGENCTTNQEIPVKNNLLPVSLKDFSDTYSDALNTVYFKNGRKISFSRLFITPSCFVLCFEYGNKANNNVKIERHDNLNFHALTNEPNAKSVVIKKITIIYSKNKIFLIKPKQLRYWLKSTALFDADTTIADIISLNLPVNDL